MSRRRHHPLVTFALATLACACATAAQTTPEPAEPTAPAEPTVLEPAPPGQAMGALELDPAIAPLFDEESAWRFQVERTRRYWDDTHPDADANGMVEETETATATCTVGEVVDVGHARASSVFCDSEFDLTVQGYWLVTAEGLFTLGALPSSAELLEAEAFDAELQLPTPPRVLEDTQKDEEGFGSLHRVTETGDGWCVEHESWGGDEAGEKLCLAPELGPVSGSLWWAGGSEETTTFELAR